jgi:cyclophilin family peptidyl-prolyl cis-trans isomerase
MKKQFLIFALALTTIYSCKKEESNGLPDGLFAKIETNKGNIILQLNYDKAPITVANFVSLAEGKNEFVTNENLKNRPFFDGMKFHRVIANFMIQTGDPLGNGSGDAGYKFKDEICDLRFDKGGVLAMANSGTATNSSQFFITHLETPWLDGKHTIFGHVVQNGMETVNKILQDDFMTKVTIIRNGEAAKKFDAVKIFKDYYTVEAVNQKEAATKLENEKASFLEKYKPAIDAKVKYFADKKLKTTKTASGLQFLITKKGTGKKPSIGETVFIHYAGFLENGFLFDTSIENVAKTFGSFDPARAQANQYVSIPFQIGKRDGVIAGFIEGVEQLSFGDKAILYIPSNLGYGETGTGGGIIPPNANIIFEIELVAK